jgi:hypothetical protein
MGSSSPILDVSLLRAFEERLRLWDLPVGRWANPGLTDDEMDEVVAPLGLRLPIEARIWWGWYDGETKEGRGKLFTPWDGMLPLREAVDVYLSFRSMANKLSEPDHLPPPRDNPDFFWHPGWFPLLGPQLPFVIDCSVGENEPTPIRMIDWQDVDGFFEPRAGSFGQMVAWWIEAIDSGAWDRDTERQRWRSRHMLLPPELRRTQLV